MNFLAFDNHKLPSIAFQYQGEIMIVEVYALKVAFISAFITWYAYRAWINFNKCKAYEIKSFLNRREK
jgi:hypothetical protein